LSRLDGAASEGAGKEGAGKEGTEAFVPVSWPVEDAREAVCRRLQPIVDGYKVKVKLLRMRLKRMESVGLNGQ
jgi:hypothetical protein